MRITRHVLSALGAVALACLLAAPAALASPITVNLRVEGSSTTLFEGPVATEAIAPPGFTTESTPEAHPCDVSDNGANEGFVPKAASPTAALYEMAVARGLAFNAEWFSSLKDFEVSKVGPDANGGEAEGFPSWGYAVNDTTANVGGCQFQLAPGSEVLWAYNYFNLAHLLTLAGAASAEAGAPFTVHVTEGRTGEPMQGAAIGQVQGGVTTPLGPVTDAAGNATVTLSQAGTYALKATRSDSVRSNALTVCVHSGNDGTCGTTIQPSVTPQSYFPIAPPVAAVASILGIRNGHVYPRRLAPRLLRGVVHVPAGATLRQVRISLQRRHAGHCLTFSGTRGAFVRSRCGRVSFFSVGGSVSFSYLLPSRLPAGRYVYDIQAIEASGRPTGLVGGVSHVVFRVR